MLSFIVRRTLSMLVTFFVVSVVIFLMMHSIPGGPFDGTEMPLPDTIKARLPAKLYETAYAVGCDIVAADHDASREELRLLELLRDKLGLDGLVSAAIERGARARHMTL